MQRYCTELTERLLKSLDKEYNVVDMGAVVDVITALEKTTITKEVLEVTRLGKYINELRRKTSNDALAKRAKDLVRRWRDMVLPSAHTQPQPTLADTAPQALNGTKPQSPALRGLKPQSPASFRSLKPQSPALKAPLKPHSPLMRDSMPLRVLSPALSLHSDHSRSPNLPTSRQHHHLHQQPSFAQTAPPPTSGNNHSNLPLTPKLGPITAQNHTIEAVPRTHSSNKRLRKENTSLENSPLTSPAPSSLSSHNKLQDSLVARTEPVAKRQRLNGENPSIFSTTETSTSSRNNNDVSRLSAPNCCATTGSSTTDQQVPSPETKRTNDRVPEVAYHDDTSPTALASDSAQITLPGPKKRGRKKGSKSVKNQPFPEDRVKEKLASISRNPKLKTTQELLADLQARGSTAGSGHFGTGTPTTVAPPRATEPPSTEEILRNAANDERPLSSRFLRMKREKLNLDDGTKKNRSKTSGKHWGNSRKMENEDEEDIQEEEEEEGSRAEEDDVRRRRVLTVEEILAKLPPLDRDAISWSDTEDTDAIDVMRTPERREICDSDVERLHGDCVEGLNGNFEAKVLASGETRTEEESANEVRIEDIRIEESNEEAKRKSVYRRSGAKDKDRDFREWHEMLARPSYDGQILHILPYVIID